MHLGRPCLLLLFPDRGAIAQEMRHTDAMRTVIGVIALPAVPHGSPLQARPDANGLQGLLASFSMPGQVGQEASTVDVQPVEFASDAYPGFIPMREPAHAQSIGNALHGLFQHGCCELDPARERAFLQMALAQISEQLAGTCQRHQLILVQIDRQGSHPRPILRRG